MYGLTRTWKNEIAHHARWGRVNAVAPGWTVTPMAKEAVEDKTAVRRSLQTMAMRKFAKPEDVASAIAFLLSDQAAGHISGQTVMVHGGMEGRKLYEPEDIDLSRLTS